MDTNYQRVIPRDFFNEAKLLKCMGLLSLYILDCKVPDGITIEINHKDEPFQIGLSQAGYLGVTNYHVKVNGVRVKMVTTYNSKRNYPLLCYHDNCEYLLFDEQGQFDDEFIEFARSLKTTKKRPAK